MHKSKEGASKAAWWTDLVAAADHCASRDMRSAATALLAEGLDAGTWDADAERRVLEWNQAGFPGAPQDASERARLAARWAREILPAGGRWAGPEDLAVARSRTDLWQGRGVALRSRNVLLLSLAGDPAVVGAVLRRAERTVRDLERYFGRGLLEPAYPLEVRLFRERSDYLAEADGTRTPAIWTAGFFSPADAVSRFCAPRVADEPAVTALLDVLSHELTHHWVETRGVAVPDTYDFPSTARAGAPGHWIVEGVAEFVAGQETASRGVCTFDDPRASPILDAAELARAGRLLPLAEFVDTSREKLAAVRIREDEGDSLAAFHAQAGALAFFMNNERGPEGRKLFLRYLKDVYGGRMDEDGWRQLGFSSADELQDEFTNWITSVR